LLPVEEEAVAEVMVEEEAPEVSCQVQLVFRPAQPMVLPLVAVVPAAHLSLLKVEPAAVVVPSV
jgi:hypothetical protein